MEKKTFHGISFETYRNFDCLEAPGLFAILYVDGERVGSIVQDRHLGDAVLDVDDVSADPDEGFLEATISLEGETIDIRRWGLDDYSAEYHNGDFSVRGTLRDIVRDVNGNLRALKKTPGRAWIMLRRPYRPLAKSKRRTGV